MNALWLTFPRTSCQHIQATRFRSLCDSFAQSLVRSSCRPLSTSRIRGRNGKRSGERIHGCISRQSTLRPQYQLYTCHYASTLRILTSFDELPRNYKDHIGLAFRAYPLTTEEIVDIFQFAMDPGPATKVLEIVHGRRVAGTLEDPDPYRDKDVAERFAYNAALEWLRANVPVDEEYNAGKRAEMVLMELDPDALVHDTSGLYVPNSGMNHQRHPYGESVLDRIKETKKMQREAQEWRQKELKTKKEANKKATGKAGLPEVSSGSTAVDPGKPGAILQGYLDRARILPNAPPDWTPFRRLWPSALATLGVLSGCVALALYYTPPVRSSRIWPDIPPSASTVGAIILVNVIVLLAWHNPPAFRFLNRYFVSVPGYPNPYSILGNVFSHQKLSHLCRNMLFLWLIGTRLHDDVGRGNFLAIYFACGALSSFASLTFYTLSKSFITSSIGASGAVCGIIGAYLWLNIWEPMRLFGMIPPQEWFGIPAWLILGFMVYGDYRLARNWRLSTHKIDFAAHLGGWASGIAAAQSIKWRVGRKRRMDAERLAGLQKRSVGEVQSKV